jgi:hypothetical protein
MAPRSSDLHLVPGFRAGVIDANLQVEKTALQRDGGRLALPSEGKGHIRIVLGAPSGKCPDNGYVCYSEKAQGGPRSGKEAKNGRYRSGDQGQGPCRDLCLDVRMLRTKASQMEV